MKLYNGDCLEIMDKLIEQNIVVDAIIADVPYGTTACKWDTSVPFNKHIMLPKSKRSSKLIPFYETEYILKRLQESNYSYEYIRDEFHESCKLGMWDYLNKLIKPNGAIVLFGSEPFSSALRMSNIKNYKYDWVWNKRLAGNVFLAKSQPMKIHENILVFNSTKESFYTIKTDIDKIRNYKDKYGGGESFGKKGTGNKVHTTKGKNPKSIIDISNANRKGNIHPTQKPVALMEYLIKTYTNENELVLDFTAGSFSTGVACKKLNRDFIGIELDKKYFDIGVKRINNISTQKGLFDEM